MQQFMDENFMLSTQTAKLLYHGYAANLPIIDYHCHINPKEIAENRRFSNITELWLGGDHYKWRAIRSCGIEESRITGDADPYDKFSAWASVMPKLIGNPLYHWSHLELQRYFGYHGALNEKTCRYVWDLCNEQLKTDALSVRGIIAGSRVETICTTDDPIDSLEYHKRIREDSSCSIRVFPAWRPDKSMNLDMPGFSGYIATLSEKSGVEIRSFSSLCQALKNRLDFFKANGCVACDHGLDYIMYRSDYTEAQLDRILGSALRGETVCIEDAERFKTALILFLAREYRRMGWIMQLHYGVIRNNNSKMFERLGPDTGFDAIGNTNSIPALAQLLDAMERQDSLPKTILYSINPSDNTPLVTVMGCFQSSEAPGKLQHGSAWWFNDHNLGMRNQIKELASCGVLGNFVGMLTDSRSFLSYTRHEYFRRILCDVLGEWAENGEYPADIEALGTIVKDISYYNTKRYFNFE